MSGNIVNAKNPSNNYQPLNVDASGRLQCSVDEIEITADTINVNLNELEALTTTTNGKLDTINTTLTGG